MVVSQKTKRSLIYESSFTGHRREYVAHLMKFIISQPQLWNRYTFILHQTMKDLLGHLTCEEHYQIKFIEFTNSYSNSIERSFKEWGLVSKIIRESGGFGEIIFLDIDPYLSLLVSKRFKKFNLSVRGILFAPYIHFKERKGSFWFFVRHVCTSYFFQKISVSFNPNIRKLLILNEKTYLPLLNKQLKNVFQFLPDPIDDSLIKTDSDTEQRTHIKYGIGAGKKNLLLFGSIDERKNLINIINALLILPASLKQRIHFVIAGKFNGDVKEKYLTHINKHKHQISIAYSDEFINDEEREVLFENCDFVLMPYIKYYGSSGILGHAIKHNKRVIVSNKGLVSRMVTEYNLGKTVDPENINEIKDAIQELLLDDHQSSYDSRKFIEEYSPFNFSKTLLMS